MKECFVIMPIGSGETYEIFRNRYENIIKPAVEGLRIGSEQVYKCIRADFISQTGSITRLILKYIYESEAVIADLSDLNPNVFYELGVRHSLRNRTILIALNGTKPPFDVGDLRIIFYDDRIGAEKKVIPQIQELLKTFLENTNQVDSPIFHAIPQLVSGNEYEKLKSQIYVLQHKNEYLMARLAFEKRVHETYASSPTQEAINEILTLFTRHFNAIRFKDHKAFLETQLNNQEIDGGLSDGYMSCSSVTTSIKEIMPVHSRFSEELNIEYMVFVKEDYYKNNEFSHTGHVAYHLVKTEDGLKIAALQNLDKFAKKIVT